MIELLLIFVLCVGTGVWLKKRNPSNDPYLENFGVGLIIIGILGLYYAFEVMNQMVFLLDLNEKLLQFFAPTSQEQLPLKMI